MSVFGKCLIGVVVMMIKVWNDEVVSDIVSVDHVIITVVVWMSATGVFIRV